MRFSLLSEQNADLMEKVINMKKSMKKLFAQMIDDFEEGVKNFKDDTKKENNETTKVLMKLVKKVD